MIFSLYDRDMSWNMDLILKKKKTLMLIQIMSSKCVTIELYIEWNQCYVRRNAFNWTELKSLKWKKKHWRYKTIKPTTMTILQNAYRAKRKKQTHFIFNARQLNKFLNVIWIIRSVNYKIKVNEKSLTREKNDRRNERQKTKRRI